MAGIKKRNLMQAGIILLSLYFLVDGLTHLMDITNRAKALSTKSYNLETSLYNAGYPTPPFHSAFV